MTKIELIVDGQRKFNHIGSSMPKLIIMKLSKSAKKGDKAYGDILNSLEGESSMPVQTPLNLLWLFKRRRLEMGVLTPPASVSGSSVD